MAGKQNLNYSSAVLLDTAIASGITSREELANLMGNADVETRGFSTMHENLGYRSARAILNATGSADERFTLTQIESAVASKDPRRIAEILYECRSDLGNNEPGDGWKFHGRGYFQYTGRDNYDRFGQKFGVDLVNHPDLAAEPATAAKLAIAYWQERVPVRYREDVRSAALIINGGTNGMEARIAASKAWEVLLTPSLIEGFVAGRITAATYCSVSAPEQRKMPDPPAPATSEFRGTETGHRVNDLQQTLALLGYRNLNGHPLAIDGQLGPNTTHAIKSFQRAHHLKVDGVVGKDTRAALIDAHHSPLLSEATHPRHHLYVQILHGIHELPIGTYRNEQERTNAAVALTISADVQGLRQIDHVVLGTNGANLFAVQGRMDDPAHRRVYIDHEQAKSNSFDYATAALQASQVRMNPVRSQVEQRSVVQSVDR